MKVNLLGRLMFQCYRKPQRSRRPINKKKYSSLSVYRLLFALRIMQFEARFSRVNVTLKTILEWGANRLYKSSASSVERAKLNLWTHVHSKHLLRILLL